MYDYVEARLVPCGDGCSTFQGKHIEQKCKGGVLSGRHGHVQVSARGYIREDPGVGAGKVRLACDTPEYRPGKTKARDHRAR